MSTARSRSKKRRRDVDTLTNESIKQRVGERSFRRGQEYVESDAIFSGRRQGDVLKAQCYGQSAESYFVNVRLSKGRIEEADCSCPVGVGGYCKHVAALLLTWLQAPDKFPETAPLAERLAEYNKPQLITVIEQMIEREPDLESWLELMLPTTGASGNVQIVNAEAYCQQTVAAFSNAGYGREEERELTSTLESLKKIGDRFRSQKNVESAAAVQCGILEGFMSEYESFHDENGDVCEVAQECLNELRDCLPQLAKGSQSRGLVLRTLLGFLRFDLHMGGLGLSDDVPEILLKHATTTERVTIVEWIRSELPTENQDKKSWESNAWGDLLLDFMEGEYDDDAYLKHCQEFGLTHKLVQRLLERGRLDEAQPAIHSSSDYSLTTLADLLIAHKQINLAHSLVRDRYSKRENGQPNWQLSEWLIRFYESRKNWQSLIELHVKEFRRAPNLTIFQEIRKLAKKLKAWPALRDDLLSAAKRNSGELIRIYLDEGEIEQALVLLESHSKKGQRGYVPWDRIELEVAQKAEKSHPEPALKIYCAEVEGLIAARGRQSYQSACGFLRKIRKLFQAVGRGDQWDDYISQLRIEHRSLRALQEELKKADL